MMDQALFAERARDHRGRIVNASAEHRGFLREHFDDDVILMFSEMASTKMQLTLQDGEPHSMAITQDRIAYCIHTFACELGAGANLIEAHYGGYLTLLNRIGEIPAVATTEPTALVHLIYGFGSETETLWFNMSLIPLDPTTFAFQPVLAIDLLSDADQSRANTWSPESDVIRSAPHPDSTGAPGPPVRGPISLPHSQLPSANKPKEESPPTTDPASWEAGRSAQDPEPDPYQEPSPDEATPGAQVTRSTGTGHGLERMTTELDAALSAADGGESELVELIQRHGSAVANLRFAPDFAIESLRGATLLELAVALGQTRTVEALMNAGARADLRGRLGVAALDLAANDATMLRLLGGKPPLPRSRWRFWALTFLIASSACEPAVAPNAPGRLGLTINLDRAVSRAPTSYRVRIDGPTSTSLTLSPGSTQSATGLEPGSYSIVVEGLLSGLVEVYGERREVTVVSGQESSVNVNFLSNFAPSFSASMPSTVNVGQPLTVRWNAVQGAQEYVLDWSVRPDFATRRSERTQATTLTVPAQVGPGQLFLRIRAVNLYGAESTTGPLGVVTIVGAGSGFFASMSVGGRSTCAISVDRSAYCWGQNAHSQSGNGSTAPSTTPTPVSGGLQFASIGSGNLHTCGVSITGAGYCWGWNGDTFGTLGDGTNARTRDVPTAVVGGLTFASLAVGYYHNCGVTTSGAAHCWGWNESGVLGIGTIDGPTVCPRLDPSTPPYACSFEPVAVTGGLGFNSVVAGGHSCGESTAGSSYCWGNNATGQLGTGAVTAPEPAPVAVGGSVSFVALSAGLAHTCGLISTGAAYCWGRNAEGQLGIGSSSNALSPSVVAGGLNFHTLLTSTFHTCGVTLDGAAYCWGKNDDGQLGDGTLSSRNQPVPVAGGLLFKTLATSGGASQHTCGVTLLGDAYCWGNNTWGQLGDGTTTQRSTPTQVLEPT